MKQRQTQENEQEAIRKTKGLEKSTFGKGVEEKSRG